MTDAGGAVDWTGIGAVRCASASSGLTTTRKVVALDCGSWSTRESASMMGVRIRLVNCAAVRSFGTSR